MTPEEQQTQENLKQVSDRIAEDARNETKEEIPTSKNQALQNKLRKMRDEGLIKFTDKNDYTAKLHLLAKEQGVDYTTAYKAMKKVAKESGDSVGKPTAEKKTINDKKTGKQTFQFNAKATSKADMEIQKNAEKLKQKETELHSQLRMQEQILQSPAFDMMSQQNLLNLQMVKMMIDGLGGKTGTDKQYEMLAKQLTLKELESGFTASGHVATALLGVSIIGVFVLPMLPQLKELLWGGKNKEDIEQSEEALDEIPPEDNIPAEQKA